jgi:hypothetical protein
VLNEFLSGGDRNRRIEAMNEPILNQYDAGTAALGALIPTAVFTSVVGAAAQNGRKASRRGRNPHQSRILGFK